MVKMKHLVKTVLIMFCVVSAAHCLDFDSNEVKKHLQEALDCRIAPGMAVAVVKDGQILYSQGFGVKNLETKEPVTDESVFGIASVTKSFAAALLVKLLHQETKLTLDSKVHELLGDQFVMPDDLRTQETTFVDLLAHKTALLANNRIRFDTNFTRQTLLSRFRLLPTNQQFRVDWTYNNLVYGLVTRLAEILGNETKWEDLITEHFFKPLGMTNSSFATRLDFTRADVATGYTMQDKGVYTKVDPEFSRRWADMCGSGSIVSSVKDMAQWMMFHLSRGKNQQGVQVMNSDLVEELHTGRYIIKSRDYLDVQRPEYPVTGLLQSYALGLRTGHYRGFPMIGHTGGTFGYKSNMVLLPTENIGVIVMVNGDDPKYQQRAPVTYYLLDRALGLEPWLNASTLCSFPKPWETTNWNRTYRELPDVDAKHNFPIAEYQGLYTNKAWGTFIVRRGNSSGAPLTGTYGWGIWELFPWPETDNTAEERFYGKGLKSRIPFDLTPIYFIPHPNRANTVVGIRATKFEPKRPPIFCKPEHKKACEMIIARDYPLPENQQRVNVQHDRQPPIEVVSNPHRPIVFDSYAQQAFDQSAYRQRGQFPYGLQGTGGQNPYGQGQPYGQPGSNQYGKQPGSSQGQNPYGQGQSPYGQPGQSPYGLG